MVGTAVQRLSNCVTANDMLPVDDGSGVDNSTTYNMTCENEPVDIAVTLSLMVGILMVSSCMYCIAQKFDKEKL